MGKGDGMSVRASTGPSRKGVMSRSCRGKPFGSQVSGWSRVRLADLYNLLKYSGNSQVRNSHKKTLQTVGLQG